MPNWAGRFCRRTKSLPASIRSSCSSDALWKRYFGADPDIVGKTIKVNAYPLTVVGVAEPAFHGTIVSFDVEVFIPMMMTPQVGAQRNDRPAEGAVRYAGRAS